MKLKQKLLLVILLLTLSLTGCSVQEQMKKHEMTATNLGFDTVISFSAYTKSEEEFETYEAIVTQRLQYYNKLFDRYTSYEGINNIKTINDAAGEKAVKADDELISLLLLARRYDMLSNHAFDASMGSVMELWQSYREQAQLSPEHAGVPSAKELQQAKKASGWKHIVIDEEKKTVFIKSKGVLLDVGGAAKGYAIEKTAQALEAAGCQHAILNGGGNVRLIGTKPQSSHWAVGVQIPNLNAQTTDSLITLQLPSSASIVTSGDYQRYYLYKGEVMHHIIDPSTLQPARHCRSVTVVCEDSAIADILSTALFVLSHEEGQHLLDQLQQEEGIEAGAIWVYDKQTPPEDDSETITQKGYELIVSDCLQKQLAS